MPEFRQLNFDLPGLVEKPREVVEEIRAKARMREARSAFVEHAAAPVEPKAKISRGRGLSLDAGLTRRCRELVSELGIEPLARVVKVYWNTRLITTAGLAHHNTGRIDLNPRLERFQPEEPRRTMLHELAHLVAHQRAKGRRIQPHGKEWRRACTELGIPGELRCHNLPLARREVRRKYAYQCRHCGIVVPRVKKLSRESACYPCCREHNRGRYSRRFMLEPISIEAARELAPEHRWG